MNLKKLIWISAAVLMAMANGAAADTPKKSDPRPPLYVAIDRHNLAAAQSAIQQGADVNAIYDRDTMLCWALRGKNQEIAKLILQSPGIDVNKRSTSYDAFGEWNRTPLILAAHMGNAEMVSLLLQKGARINAKDSTDDIPEARGNTALIKAAQRDHGNVIQVLVNEGKGLEINLPTKDGESPLWLIAQWEDLATLKFLHQHGAIINTANNAGESVLTTTELHKKREVIDYLVANGADINHLDNGGGTPLISAILTPDNKNAKTLYAYIDYFLTFKPKLDLQKVTPKEGGITALDMAARFGNVEVIALLLDHGATLDLKSLATGGTALHYAVIGKHLDAARLLIQRKANLDAVDLKGSTPLMDAVNLVDPAMVQLLVDSGASINLKSRVNVMATPLLAAASSPNFLNKKENLAILSILLSGKGDINFKSGNGTTALMAAAQQSNPALGYELAAFLIGKGANLNLTNDKGETALMLAAGAGNQNLVQLLMDKGADAKIKNGAGETVMSYAKRATGLGSLTGLGSAALLESRGVAPEAPIVRKSVVVDALLGTWTGSQDGLPQAVITLVLNRNGTYDFNSRFSPEAMKSFPKGAVSATIAAHRGSYTFNDDVMIWTPTGAAPTSMHWKLDKGVLIVENKMRLKKAVRKTP